MPIIVLQYCKSPRHQRTARNSVTVQQKKSVSELHVRSPENARATFASKKSVLFPLNFSGNEQ